MNDNYWDELMGTDEGAASYMDLYGEGPGCETRLTIGNFINDGESVLDVGCGPGWNYDHFREYGPKVDNYLGLDYSHRFVRVANKRNPGHYQLGDCRALEQPDGSYDVVLLQDVLEHTNGYEKPVTEALRVAKNRVIVTFWRMHGETTTKTNDDGKDGYGSDYNQREWEDYLNSLEADDMIGSWHQTESSPEANRYHQFYILEKEGL